MRISTTTAAVVLALAAASPLAHADGVDVFNEGFDNVQNLQGWVLMNSSTPTGNNWFQGNSGIFGAQSGASNSYIAANYLGAASDSGVVDMWLMTPVINLNGASTFSFFTRAASDPGFYDTLKVYFGAGTGTGLGGFRSLGVSIGGGSYPDSWAQYSTGLDYTGSGRFAFHYIGYASQLNYIGIDSVKVVSAVPEPASALMLGLGLGAVGLMRRRTHK